MRVAHLIASSFLNHGPSDGIRAQLSAHTPGAVMAEVWSMYAPPEGRDPSEAYSAVGATHVVLENSRAFADPRCVVPVRRALRRFRPDLLQAHLVRANLWGRLAARLEGGPPVICTLRGVEHYFSDAGLLSRAVRLAEKRTLGLVARYVAVSDGVREAAIARLGLSPAQVVTIRNAVDLSPFERPADRGAARAALGIQEGAVVIGTVSVLEPRKNLGLLLDVVGAVRQAHPEIPIVVLVAGDGPDRSALEARVAREGASYVRFLGFRRDVAALLPAFDVFLLTSRGEGLPRAVMEAMASGVPCVVTDVGGNREAVIHGTTGFVHASGDADGLAASLSRLVCEAGMRQSFGAASRRRAFEEFTPRRLALQYEELYAEVHAAAGKERRSA